MTKIALKWLLVLPVSYLLVRIIRFSIWTNLNIWRGLSKLRIFLLIWQILSIQLIRICGIVNHSQTFIIGRFRKLGISMLRWQSCIIIKVIFSSINVVPTRTLTTDGRWLCWLLGLNTNYIRFNNWLYISQQIRGTVFLYVLNLICKVGNL